jgi:hypothetical protein
VRLAAVVALLAVAVAVIILLVRWLTGELHMARAARRRQAEAALSPAEPRCVEPPPEQLPPAGPPVRRRPAAGHHPAGRRAPGTQPPRPVAVRPRRPLQLVAADLRRLTRELSMVPGGMPMARRRGLLAAFDDVLVEAAELLEVPHQLALQPPATRELERMRLLAQLEAAGLVVTD